MHPRLPRGGSLHGLVALISVPYNTAGGPFKQSPLQPGPGTKGSLDNPLPTVALGSRHFGGSAGSGNAESGKLKPGVRRQDPRLPRHPRQLHVPSVQGNASWVVVGSDENKQLPLGSIAGKRNWAQPVDSRRNIPAIQHTLIPARDCSRAEVR